MRFYGGPAEPRNSCRVLSESQIDTLYRATRERLENAVEIMDQNWEYPKTWLFLHRWENGGKCPRWRTSLVRELVGGRRTCWCPECQPK